MSIERRMHPSGRPVRVDRSVSIERAQPRVPYDEPLTPRLRRPINTVAIGFGLPPLPEYDAEG
jgi:hypothetical protein